jgi:hypothetical protein
MVVQKRHLLVILTIKYKKKTDHLLKEVSIQTRHDKGANGKKCRLLGMIVSFDMAIADNRNIH